MWDRFRGASVKTAQFLRADRGNRDRVRVMSVGLPQVPGVEHPEPVGQLRWQVNHVPPSAHKASARALPAALVPPTTHVRSG